MKKKNKYLYGTEIKKCDYMHKLFGYAMPNRCDNEAYFKTTIDLSKAKKFIDKQNNNDPKYKYTIFQLFIAAICKTTILMPKLNRFYKGHKYYQRNETTVSFVVKNKFELDSAETVAFVKVDGNDNIESIQDQMDHQINECRQNKKTDESDATFNKLNSIPNWILTIVAKIIMNMEKKAKVPDALFEGNPYYSSWFVANLGSIGIDAVYHHLANYGTNSCFCTIGKIENKEFIDKNGNKEFKLGVDIGITIDERIADGFYYHKSMQLIEEIMRNPEILAEQFSKKL